MLILTIENTGNLATTFDISPNALTHVMTILPVTQVVLPSNA